MNAGYHTVVVPLERDIVRNVHAVLKLLWGGVLFVLLIAAVNITNLALVRASGRLKELATRQAFGRSAAKRRSAAGHRGDCCSRSSVRRPRSRPRLVEPRLAHVGRPRGPAAGLRESGSTASSSLFVLGLALVLGIVIGAVPAMQLAGIESERGAPRRGPRRHGRARRPQCPARTRRRSGGPGLRAARQRRTAAEQFPPAASGGSRLHRRARRHRSGQSARDRSIRTMRRRGRTRTARSNESARCRA